MTTLMLMRIDKALFTHALIPTFEEEEFIFHRKQQYRATNNK